VPYVVKNVSSANFLSEFTTLDVLLAAGVQNGVSVVQWNVNGSVIDVDWEDPTLSYVESGNTTYPEDLNLIQLPTANTVSATPFATKMTVHMLTAGISCTSGSSRQLQDR
jgi:hypothetical protein